ncbi:MAG: hypothetical protein AAFV45_00060 [Pseudomonadota bacterium]
MRLTPAFGDLALLARRQPIPCPNFVTEVVARIGACCEQIADILKRHFG